MPPGTANELIADIERRVAAGDLRPGQRLQPVRAVASELGLAPNTVASAYRRLRERGVVVGRGRQGTVVADRPLVAAILSSEVPEGVIDAMSGNPDTALLPDCGEALRRAVAAGPARYGQALVDADLATTARALFEADGVDAGHLTVVNGAMDAVERLLLAHLRPGDRVGVEDPGYASVHQLVTALGFAAVPISIDTEGIIPDHLQHALTEGLQALVVTPRSQNPTGAAFTRQRAGDISDVLARHPETFVIEDDHAGPVAGVPFVGIDRQRPRWALVRSVSKSLGPDLRLALVTGDPETVDRIEGRLQVGPGWVSHLLQRAAAHLLVDETAQAAVAAAAQAYAHRRSLMIEHLAQRGITGTGPSGLHVWVPVSDEQSVVLGLRDRGFAIRAGDGYRLAAPPAVRITTAALTDPQAGQLAEAFAEVVDRRDARSRIA